MPKINVLDSSIYNRISAGEVVERPASVVKELVENSLDAKATSITIEIQNGGTKLIKIVDNGCGIDYNDLKKAFLPHATSKISSVDDLDGIITLGFRGEALASIASVSRAELISKTKENDVGGVIRVNGGAFEEVNQIGCADGTVISIKDLFYNTPARLKFLKSNKQEEGAITNIVNRLMLANPDITFKYIVDGKLVYNATAKGLKNKIFEIYGKETLENLIEVNKQEKGYTISGYISKPTFCKANKTYQTLLINNRYVSNSLIGVAVSNAYENFLMKGKFPFFVLNLTVNFEDIDVNVHPSKMEVKFKNSGDIYSLFYSVILETLNENNCPIAFGGTDKSVESFFETKSINKAPDQTLNKVEGGFSFGNFEKFANEIKTFNVDFSKKENPSLKSSYIEVSNDFTKQPLIKDEDLEKISISDILENKRINNFETNPISQEELKQESFINQNDYKIIGSFFNTYIVIESNNSLYILDEHAGHERVLFDKFIEQFEKNKLISQELLVPYAFSVNEIEKELIDNNLDIFKQMGFEIEEFGYLNYRIVSIPSVLEKISLQDFIFDMLKNTNKISSNNQEIRNYFAKCACRAAVKAGKKLSEMEINCLLNEIFKNNTTLLCPHGRPICLKLTKTEIEKMFKRIV